MANKKLIGLNGGRKETIGTNDVAVIEGGAQIDGDLTVAGDIISRGAVDVVIQDQFLELANGQTSETNAPSGYVSTVAAANGINYTVASFTNPTTITLTADDDTNATFFSGDIDVTTNFTGTETVAVQDASATATTFTCIATGTPTNVQFLAGASAEDTAVNLAAAINDHPDGDFNAAASGTVVLVQLTADAGSNSPTIVFTANSGSGAATPTDFGTDPLIPQGTIIMISDLDDTANDGLYAVQSTSANTITIKTSAQQNTQVKFTQTSVTTGTETGDNSIRFVDLYVQTVSDGVIQDSGGAITAGTLADVFVTFADEGKIANSYNIVGAGETTLDDAYNAGNTITLDSAGGDLTISGDQSVSISTSDTADNAISITASGNTGQSAIVISATDASAGNADANPALDIDAANHVRVRGGEASSTGRKVTIESRSTSTASNVGQSTQDGAMQITTDGGLSVVTAKASAISMIESGTGGSREQLTIGAYKSDESDNIPVLALKGKEVFTSITVRAAEAITNNQALAMIGSHAFGDLSVDNYAGITAAETLILTTSEGTPNVYTITFQSSGGTDTTFSGSAPNFAADIDLSADTDADAVADAISTLYASISDYNSDVQGSFVRVQAVTNSADYDITFSGTVDSGDIATSTADAGTGVNVVPADADAAGTSQFIGLANGATSVIDDCEVVTSGVFLADCSTAVASGGDELYLSTAVGEVTTTAPSATGDTIFKVGRAMASKATGAGTILVALQPEFVAELS